MNMHSNFNFDARTLHPAIVSDISGSGMSRRILRRLLSSLSMGSLEVRLPSGQSFTYQAPLRGPSAVLVLHRWRALRRMVFKGDLGFADGYMDGDWSTPDLTALIELAAHNLPRLRPVLKGSKILHALKRLQHGARANTKRGAKANILAHYDLGNAFYRQWLDEGMSYSSAIFGEGVRTLEDAQHHKQQKILSRLALQGGEKVLEVGIGWGGLASALVKAGSDVTGVTLSPSQLAYARDRLSGPIAAGKADLRLQDYRDVEGRFDRIVSIEMFEAVGEAFWPVYFQKLNQSLAADGIAVLQIITIADDRFHAYREGVDFIQRYIFPGGMLPSRTILRSEVERAGLQLQSAEMFGLDYARTLAEWKRRFLHAWPQIEPLGFDLKFKRMWEYYLSYCEAGFRAGAIDVGLYTLTHTEAKT